VVFTSPPPLLDRPPGQVCGGNPGGGLHGAHDLLGKVEDGDTTHCPIQVEEEECHGTDACFKA
jgi:hypothetical protein